MKNYVKTFESYNKIEEGKYQYEGSHGETHKGAFNIYQARNGAIMLVMGSSTTPLTMSQINDLSLDVYSLMDFDMDDFQKYYNK